MAIYSLNKDPGMIMESIRDIILGNAGNVVVGMASITWEFGSVLGKQAVEVAILSGEITTTFLFVCACLDADEVMPMRSMISFPGFECGYSVNALTSLEDPIAMSLYVDYWKTYLVDLKVEMINTWSTGSPRTTVYDSIDVVAGDAESHLAIIAVADGDGVYVSREEANFGATGTDLEDEYTWAGWNTPIPSGSGGGSGGVTQLVEAINNLALQNFDVSLNHGQTIFSVRGATVTGS